MREEIRCEFKVYDNVLEIIPQDNKMEDNYYYEIEIDTISPLDEVEKVNDIYIGIHSRMHPYYTSVFAVNSIVGQYEVPEDVILFHIREASRYVDYVLSRVDTSRLKRRDIEFRASQYVKYAAAYDCVLRMFVDKASMAGIKGELADVKFDNNGGTADLDKLLKALKDKKKLWDDILQGRENVGNAAPMTAVRGIRAIPEYHSVPTNWNHGIHTSNINDFRGYRGLYRNRNRIKFL